MVVDNNTDNSIISQTAAFTCSTHHLASNCHLRVGENQKGISEACQKHHDEIGHLQDYGAAGSLR
jgi:hypothetical protein